MYVCGRSMSFVGTLVALSLLLVSFQTWGLNRTIRSIHMHLPHTSIRSRVSAKLRGEVDTHLRDRWLLIARIAWVAVVVLTLAVFIVGLPVYFTKLQTACVGAAACALNGALNPTDIRALQSLG